MPIRRSGDNPTKFAESVSDPESIFTVATTEFDHTSDSDGSDLIDDTFGLTEDPSQGSMAEATRVVGPHRPSTPTESREDPMTDPPVGWLVVVRGPGKGRTLTLGHGLNIIGRSAAMRVCIDFGDNNISRTNHARIVYEPRERRFFLSHGDGTNLTYLNNELVMGAVNLQSGSEIQIGDTTVRFQALCGEEFDWPDVDD